MINCFNAYRVLSSKAFRVTMDILSLVYGLLVSLFVFTFQNSYFEHNAGQYIDKSFMSTETLAMLLGITGLMTIIYAFSDYFLFAGTAARHTGVMNYLRTSMHGEKVLGEAVTGDFIRTAIRTFIALPCAGIVSSSIVNGRCSAKLVLMFLVVWGAMLTTICISNLLCRRFAKTLLLMVIFMYVVGVIFGIFVVSIVILTNSMTTLQFDILPAMIVIAVFYAGLAVMFFILSRKDVIKGYRSGFEDVVGGK